VRSALRATSGINSASDAKNARLKAVKNARQKETEIMELLNVSDVRMELQWSQFSEEMLVWP